MAEESQGFKWWRDLPGWVQAVVAVLGLLGVGTVAGGVVHSVTSTPRSHPAPLAKSAGPTPASVKTVVRWHGSVAINDSGTELDDLPPMTNVSVYTFRNYGGLLIPGNSSIAVWTGSSVPTYSQCHTLVQTHGDTANLQLTSGMEMCVLTGGGRTAYVHITSLSSDGSTAEAEATVWGQASGASSSGTSPGSTPSGTAVVRWHGSVAINDSGTELDDLPPMTNVSVYTFRNYGGLLIPGNSSIAVWTGSSVPTYSQCHTFVQTHGDTANLQLTSGMEMCVLTGGGRTAYVHITSLSSDGSTAGAQVTVWNQ
jgi:hypothetical protein